jgi:alpha-mannosidase
MITVHLIIHSHIDPIWLWPWQSGLDSALNTCRSMCDRLDTHPDVVFTCGEAWLYRQIERVDPGLFRRIRGHVESGAWEITGGWWIQPDCNLPSGFALERQIDLGRGISLTGSECFRVWPSTSTRSVMPQHFPVSCVRPARTAMS